MHKQTLRFAGLMLGASFLVLLTFVQTANAQPFRAPRCTNGTVSGTYGYRMNGSIVGVGPFLVNGLFTHNADGTSSVKAYVAINGQTFLTTGINGTFKVNDDCSGSGTFYGPELMQQINYDFVSVDGGNQIQILNTNNGIVLQGYGRRIAPPGRAPRCNNGMILGNYGYRLDGNLPGIPSVAMVGIFTQSLDGDLKGALKGFDSLSLHGVIVPRRDYQGTFHVENDCLGKGFYTDSLGQTVNYFFTVVDDGKEIYALGANSNGDNISGVAQRVR